MTVRISFTKDTDTDTDSGLLATFDSASWHPNICRMRRTLNLAMGGRPGKEEPASQRYLRENQGLSTMRRP
jgi:hypothetical protein